MATSYSPKIITDDLVFMYDTDDGKSFKGEPTTNLQASGSAGVHASSSGNVVSVTDASAEKGAGWKKVTITARGTNHRTLQFTYTSMAANTMYSHSALFDWGNMRDKGYAIYFDGNGTGSRAYYRAGDYSNTASESINSTMPDGKFAGTITHTSSHSHAFFVKNNTTGVSGLNDFFYYKEYQVEINTHPTQFTTGTRSATQGLLDRTGTSTIDISNASFDSDAQMVFDGTDDYADVSATDLFQPQNTTDGFTVEYVYRPEANTSAVPVGNLSSTNGWFQAPISNSSLGAYLYFSTDGVVLSTDSSYAINSGIIGKYQHIVMVLKWSDTVNSFIMVNGEDKTASKATASKYTVSGSANPALRIGKRGGSIWPANGQIPLIKIYNRALTAAEVLQNYNATKGRFGL